MSYKNGYSKAHQTEVHCLAESRVQFNVDILKFYVDNSKIKVDNSKTKVDNLKVFF